MNAAVWIVLIGLVLVTVGLGVALWLHRRRLRAVPAPAPASAPAPVRKALPPRGIELGGRRFVRMTEWPVVADIWLGRTLKESGLDKIEKPAGQPAEAMVEEVLTRLWHSDKALELLGGWMRPEDEPAPASWSIERAIAQGQFFGTLSTPEDRMAVRGLFAEMLAYFFTTGLVSLRTSPNSSSAESAGAGSGMGPGSTSAGSPITATGAPPSSSSPAATPTGSASF